MNQVGEVIRALGQNPTEADVKRLVQQTNKNTDGRVSFETFLPILQQVRIDLFDSSVLERIRIVIKVLQFCREPLKKSLLFFSFQVSQKKMTDTVDDFVEGLRHFDKVGKILQLRQYMNCLRYMFPRIHTKVP